MDHTMASSYFMKRISIQVDFVIITMEMEQCCGYDPYIDDIECQVFFLIPSSLSLSYLSIHVSLIVLPSAGQRAHCASYSTTQTSIIHLQKVSSQSHTYTQTQLGQFYTFNDVLRCNSGQTCTMWIYFSFFVYYLEKWMCIRRSYICIQHVCFMFRCKDQS